MLYEVCYEVYQCFMRYTSALKSAFALNQLRKIDFIKHFVLTNCRKEQPGSIVTETLKNGNIISKDT